MADRQDGLLQGSEWEKVGLESDILGSLPDLLISNSFVGTFTTPSRYFFNDWILVISLAVKSNNKDKLFGGLLTKEFVFTVYSHNTSFTLTKS